MIKINLLGEESSNDASVKMAVAGYAASVIIVLVVCAIAFSSASRQIDDLTQRSKELDARLAQLKVVTEEVRELEKKRKALNEKLVVIAMLKKNKRGPVRVLDDLNSALPERAWIVDAKEASNAIRISGLALDNETIAEFMRKLDASEYFEAVELVETRQATKDGARVRSFALNAKLNYAGKLLVDEAKPTESNAKGGA